MQHIKVLLESPGNWDSGGVVAQNLRYLYKPAAVDYLPLWANHHWCDIPPFDIRLLYGLVRRTVDRFIHGLSAVMTMGFGARINARGGDLVHARDTCLHRYSRPTLYERSMTVSYLLKNYYGFKADELSWPIRFEEKILRSKKCCRILAWTEWVKKKLIELYDLPEEKVVVVPPPIPIRKSSIKKVERNSVSIIFFGGQFYRKGGELAIRVLCRLAEEYENMNVIIRSNDLPPEYEKTVVNLRNFDIINRSVSRGELYNKIYPHTDIFFLPTRADSYGMAILEAMSMGIPVVTSDLPPLRELVTEGAGYVCDPCNEDAFYFSLKRLMENPNLRTEMGERARKSVLTRFHPMIIAEKLYQVYLEALRY